MKSMKQILTLSATLLLAFAVTAQMPGGGGGGSEATDVSEQELKNFANAMGDVQKVQQEHQQKMVQAVKESGLSVQKYQKIAQAEQNPQQEVEASEEEMQKYNSAQGEVQTVQQDMQSEMKETFNEHDLTQQRFQEISQAVRQDQELQKKVRSMMNEGQGGQQRQAPNQNR